MMSRPTFAELTARLMDPAAQRTLDTITGAPTQPGVYAWHAASHGAMQDLGLDLVPQVPLYVGISERLRSRLAQHLPARAEDGSELILRLVDLMWEVGSLPPSLVALAPAYREPPGGPMAEWDRYVVAALRAWMRENLRVSWVTTDTRQAAAAFERHAIAELRPVLNRAGAGPRAQVWTQLETRSHPDFHQHMHEWGLRRDLIVVIARNADLLAGITALQRLDLPFDSHWNPLLAAPAEVRGVSDPFPAHRIAVFGDELVAGAQRTALEREARPGWLYRTPARQVFGDPPPWEHVLAGLTEPARRSMIALHLSARLAHASAISEEARST
jgi:hypothetical protein